MKKGGRFTLTRHTHTHVWIEFYNCIVCVWFGLKWNEWIPSHQMKKRERKRVRKESIDLLDCVRSFSQIVEHCISVCCWNIRFDYHLKSGLTMILIVHTYSTTKGFSVLFNFLIDWMFCAYFTFDSFYVLIKYWWLIDRIFIYCVIKIS